MTVVIPSHLRNVEVINQMYILMTAYMNYYATDPVDLASESSLEEKAFDYIYDFIKIIYPDNDEPTNRYIASMLYRCKGTTKVFEVIEKYLGLVYKEDPEYNIDKLSLSFDYVGGSNLLNFKPALINTLNTLLYFNELKVLINIFKLQISSSMSNKSTNMCVFYKDSYFEFK